MFSITDQVLVYTFIDNKGKAVKIARFVSMDQHDWHTWQQRYIMDHPHLTECIEVKAVEWIDDRRVIWA